MKKIRYMRTMISIVATLFSISAVAQLEEIIVTAQKRPQNLQDVSLSVTSLNIDALNKGGITDVSRVDLLVPGVNFAFAGNDARFNVRGANSSNTFQDNAPIVGMFTDGVYKPRASQQTRQFYDVQRLEFLRGPQGTLYGRNTLAGALNVYTNKPDTDSASSGVDASYGRFNRTRVEGFFNVPINGDLAIRIAGFKQDSDGYVNNSAGPDLGADDELGIRISALWNISETANLLFRYSYADEGGTSLGVFSHAGLCRPEDVDGLTDAAGGNLNCNNPSRGSAGATPFDVTGPYNVEHDFVNESDLTEHNFTLEGNFDLGPVSLKSITSFTDYDSLIGEDGDFSATPFRRIWSEEAAESFTQELILSSNTEGRLQWTGGLYYSEDTVFSGFSRIQHTEADPFTFNQDSIVTAAIPEGLRIPFFPGFLPGLRVQRLEASSISSFETSLNGHEVTASEVESDYSAAYFQTAFAVTNTFRVIAGLRYNNEEKSLTSGFAPRISDQITILDPDDPICIAAANSTNPSFNVLGCSIRRDTSVPPITIRPGLGNGASPATVPRKPSDIFVYDLSASGARNSFRNFYGTSWRASAELDIGRATLLYITASTAYLSTSLDSIDSRTLEQKSQALEIGFKSRFLRNTLQLNGVYHQTDYTNLPQPDQPFGFFTESGFPTIDGGKINAEGLELEVGWAPNHKLILAGNVTFLDSKYGKFNVRYPYQTYSGSLPITGGTPVTINDRPTLVINRLGSFQLEGQTTPWSPDVTFNISGSYLFDLEGGSTLIPSFQISYSDSYNVAGFLPVDPTGDQNFYTKTDIRLSWISPNELYRIEGFVENLEDEAVNAQVNLLRNQHTQASFLFPKNWGIRFKARF